jgi:4-amino-4-deoxy-L-arabinose transferase-like glycosyltransferase
VITALTLRVLWWFFYPFVISNEGAEYARLAQNLIAGRGYVGMMGGPHVFFPPLYPLLIGVIAWFGGSEEFAARLISLVSGVGLVAVVYLLARRAFDKHVATIAGVLAACHPLLVAISISVYSESLFLFLLIAGTFFAVDALGTRSVKRAAMAGVMFGFAYLTRPEGIAFAMLFAGLLASRAVWARHNFWVGVRQAAALLAIAALLAVPYVAYLSEAAGAFRWEGKSAGNNVINARMTAGMSHAEAALGLREVNGRRGPWLDLADARVLLRQRDAQLGGLADELLSAPAEKALRLGKDLAAGASLGSPAVLLLALAGIASRKAWHGRAWEAGGLLTMLGLQLLILMSVRFLGGRFLWGMAPLLVIWAAVGIRSLSGLVFERISRRVRLHGMSTTLVAAALIGTVVLISLRGVWRAADIAMERDRLAAQAGSWIYEDFEQNHADDRQPVVMAFGGVITYYARGIVKFYPYADEEQALRYIHEHSPQYLILRGREVTAGPPYVGKWLKEGIPDPCAEVMRKAWTPNKEPLTIWRWNCGR